MAKGCDYSWGRPSMQSLKDAGISFVCRYVSHDNTGKNITAGEASQLRASGIDIVTNWEFQTHAPLNGRAQGISDAATGINMAQAAGAPSSAAIYFSVDFDAQDSDMHQIAAYIDGATATIGYDRVGVYGGYRVIANMAATNRCKYFWQTYAWSHGVWHPQVHIRQTLNGQRIGGADVDMDTSTVPDIGSWGGSTFSTPAVAVVNEDWDVAQYLGNMGDNFAAQSAQISNLNVILRNLR